MAGALLVVVVVIAVDQGLKWALRHLLEGRSLPLGRAGTICVVESRIWLARARFSRYAIAAVWLLGIGALLAVAVRTPSARWFAAALAGGSASHALETAVRGSVTDYVCLRVWPAFNLADVAITVGGLGLVYTLAEQITR